MSPSAHEGEGTILGPDGQPLGSLDAGPPAAAVPADDAGTEPGGGQQAMPEPTLTVHVFHLASQVAMALGEAENPVTGTRETDLRAARYLIDVIAMLEEKTRGSRTAEEDEYLGGVLTNLRMAFVSKSN